MHQKGFDSIRWRIEDTELVRNYRRCDRRSNSSEILSTSPAMPVSSQTNHQKSIHTPNDIRLDRNVVSQRDERPHTQSHGGWQQPTEGKEYHSPTIIDGTNSPCNRNLWARNCPGRNREHVATADWPHENSVFCSADVVFSCLYYIVPKLYCSIQASD